MLRQANFTIFIQYNFTLTHTYTGNILIKSHRKVSMSADFNRSRVIKSELKTTEIHKRNKNKALPDGHNISSL